MIDEYLTNPNTNISINFDTPEQLGMQIWKILMYNSLVDSPLQKFWFYVKKAKILEKKSNYITIALSTGSYDKKLLAAFDSLNTNTVQYIRQTVNKRIQKIDKLYSMRNDRVPTLTVKVDTLPVPTPFFNSEGPIAYDKLKINDDVSAYLEMSEIIVTQGEATAVWRILQAKVIEPLDFTQLWLQTSEKKVDSTIDVPSAPLPPVTQGGQQQPHQSNKRSDTVKKQLGPVRFQVSQSEIVNQLKKLNKLNKPDKTPIVDAQPDTNSDDAEDNDNAEDDELTRLEEELRALEKSTEKTNSGQVKDKPNYNNISSQLTNIFKKA
jgi:hypothetical protein